MIGVGIDHLCPVCHGLGFVKDDDTPEEKQKNPDPCPECKGGWRRSTL